RADKAVSGSCGDVLAAVGADDRPVDPARLVGAEQAHDAGHVLGGGEPAKRVAPPGGRLHALIAGDETKGRGIGHAGLHEVGSNTVRREFERHGTHDRLERDLRGRHGGIAARRDLVAFARETEHPGVGGEQATPQGGSQPAATAWMGTARVSSAIPSCAASLVRARAAGLGSAGTGASNFKLPNAIECNRRRTRPWVAMRRASASRTVARPSLESASTLSVNRSVPRARIAANSFSIGAIAPFRSRCTTARLIPHAPSFFAHASPKPLEPPRMTAH